MGVNKVSMNFAPFNRCAECDEVITNPICSDCLAARMRIMVGEYDFKLAAEIHGAEIDGNTTCIKCGIRMGLCAHCFSKDIYEFLQEQNPKLALEFAGKFDFDLRQKLTDFA